MKLHKLNLENNYRNLVDSAIAVKAGLTPAVFAARPTYNDVLLGFNDGETPTLLLPKWAQFTIDLSKNKPSWAPASLTGTLTVTITSSVVGVTAEEDEVTLGNVDVYGVSVASTGKQYKVNEGFYSIGLNVMVVNEDNVPVIAYSDGRPMKVVMQKVADTGPDTNVDVAAGGGSFTQEQADWNQSDDTAVDFIKNKPTIPAAQVNADWNAASGVAQILNKPTIPTVNDATLTFTQDGETLATFSANASTNVEVEIPAGGGGGGASIIETTWADLKALRDGGTLTPGQQYRITDYVYTVASNMKINGMPLSSANHPFDLVVIADSTNRLNEKARALRHEGDTYFPSSTRFEAWQIWYKLDNDWRTGSAGKGVIYRMIDEWNNDCPHDFKSMKFSGSFTFGGNSSGNSDGSLYGNTHDNKLSDSSILLQESCTNNTFGAGCKNIQLGSYCSYNTFDVGCNPGSSSDWWDAPYIFLGTGCTNNTFGAGCNNIHTGGWKYIGTVSSSQSFEAKVGDLVRYQSAFYKCTVDHSGTWDSSHFSTTYYPNGFTVYALQGMLTNNLSYCNFDAGTEKIAINNTTYCYGLNFKGRYRSGWTQILNEDNQQGYPTTYFHDVDGTLKVQKGSTITTVE